MTLGPAKRSCASCPYRKDVPSGVWSAEEYEKLPHFDDPSDPRSFKVFNCHQQNGRLCAGWVGCHDMQESIGLRLAVSIGSLSETDYEATLDYVSPIPLWESGAAAAEHGLRDVEHPSPEAIRIIQTKRSRGIYD